MPEPYIPHTKGGVKIAVMHDAITADVLVADAEAIECAGAESIMLTFKEGGTVNNRSGVLTIYVSNDGVNFYAYNMLVSNATNTNGQTLTRVGTITRNSAGTDVAWFSKETLGAITHFKAQVDITDGGSPTGNFSVTAAISVP